MFAEAGINVVGMSYDSVEVLKAFSDKSSIEFPLLSDEGSKVIDALGIRNKAMDGKKFGPNNLEGVPHPGTIVLDKDGVILGKLFVTKYQERHETEDFIELVKKVVK